MPLYFLEWLMVWFGLYMIYFKNRIKGFTLIELLVTISIACILVSVALPSLNVTMANSQLTANTNLIIGAINYARSEAIHRRQDVKVQLHQSNDNQTWQVVVAQETLQ